MRFCRFHAFAMEPALVPITYPQHQQSYVCASIGSCRHLLHVALLDCATDVVVQRAEGLFVWAIGAKQARRASHYPTTAVSDRVT